MTLTDPILVFTVLALVMLLAPLLARRLRVPDLVLLILAGMLLGPYGSGLLTRNTAVTLFGSVGLLYIMFLAGLEIDLHRFARTRGRSMGFGLLTFAIPQLCGTVVGVFVLGFTWPTALLLASMFASHTLLAYPIASRLGLARSEPVAVTVGATIITDTLALLVLAIIADSARGLALGPAFWLHISAGLTLLVVLAWWGIPRLAGWFFQQVPETGGAQFLFVLVTVCGFAYLSHFAKMEPIIGAFLAGAAFSRLIPEQSVLMNRVVFAGHTLFIPFFLISVGMLLDPLSLAKSPRSWLVAAVMVLAVILTKYAAAEAAGRLFGYGRDARKVMFGLSVVQAAATLAAVLVGYDLKLFDETVLNGAVAMIVVTCPLGAWMTDRHGRRLAAAAPPREPAAAGGQRLLIPVAHPDYAARLLDLSFLIRDPASSGTLHPLTIIPDAGDTEAALACGEKLLASCLTHAASTDIPVSPTVRVDVNAADGICRAAKELRATLVLSGWGGARTASARLFGSVTEQLIGTCSSRMLFCRLCRPLNTTRAVRLVLPPLADRRNDLDLLASESKRLASQLGAHLHVYLVGTDILALHERLSRIHPTLPLAFTEMPTWADVRDRLLADAEPEDLLVALGERRASPLWTPTLEKLAALLASRFAAHNLLLAYPALDINENAPPASAAHTAAPRLRACDLGRERRLARAVQLMAATAFPADAPAGAEARNLLLASAEAYPVALGGGVALLHAHCERISRPVLVVGRGSAEWALAGLAEPARTLLALLTPAADTPESHLRVLAALGRRFLAPAMRQAVQNALSAEEVVRLLEAPPVSADGTLTSPAQAQESSVS